MELENIEQRAAFRLPIITGEPVHLLLKVDGVEVEPTVAELSAGGARLVCKKHFESFHTGQILEPAVLVLKDVGLPVVCPVVKWKNWPVIGIEFMNISEKDQEMIFRFLFRIERKMLEPRRATDRHITWVM
jgi:c-di-GMP-binding flagellar brake protein YcgR